MHTEQQNQLITLFFHQKEIAVAFGEVLQSMGFESSSVQSEKEVSTGSKVITEPLYYEELSDAHRENCLVIGHGHQLTSIPGPVISRPLTPVKVERGLRAFLEIQTA